MTTAHTDLPWHAPGLGEIHNVSHDCIAQVYFNGGDPDDTDCGTEADATFIVRACNAHDDLVAAVKAFLDYDANDGDDGVQMMVDYADALSKAKAALAKAGAA